MNQKDHDRLRDDVRFGTKEAVQAARDVFKREAAIQNAREDLWTLSRLCKKISQEGNGRPLTVHERSRQTPHVFSHDGTHIQVFHWQDIDPGYGRPYKFQRPFPGRLPIYTGPLADYWHVTLGGVVT